MANVRSFFVTAACLAVIASCTSSPSSRILEGENAVVGQFPYTVSVRVENIHVGVGNIIHPRFILTAAHIITRKSCSSISLRVGSINYLSGGKVIPVAACHEHPSFGNYLHDLAILELKEPLEFNDRIDRIEWAVQDDDIVEGTHARIAGWGLNSDGVQFYKLQHTDMSVLSRENCEAEAGYGYASSLCLKHTERQGICKGDEGAGVVINNILYGIASFAFGSCGTRFPDVAVRCSYYKDWISSIVN